VLLQSESEGLGIVGDGADFDAAALGSGNPGGDLNGLFEVFGVDEVIASDLFFGFGEWPVGHDGFAVADSDGSGGGGGFEPVCADKMALRLEPIGELGVFLEVVVRVGGRQVFHHFLSRN